MSTGPASNIALLIIDMQQAFDEWEAHGRRRNNPDAIARIADLLRAFRAHSKPIFHVRHASVNPSSSFSPEGTGYLVREEVKEKEGEAVVVKYVNSAFIGTDLEAQLRGAAIETIVVCGATTNHCVETTTRMAGNLGFDAWLVRDATWTFDRKGPDGEEHSAEEIHAMALANLHEEFARIVETADVLSALR